MDKSTPGPSSGLKSKKVKSSIVYRLNSRLLLRLLVIFLILDFFILLTFGIQTMVRTERELSSIVTAIEETDSIEPDDFSWLELTGVRISIDNKAPEGFILPGLPGLPGKTPGSFFDTERGGTRSFVLPGKDDRSLFERLNDLDYRYEFISGGVTYAIAFDIGTRILELKRIMAVILVIQLILLLTGILPISRLIRSTLRPINVLAEAAHNINKETAQNIQKKSPGFKPERMEDLAETLDSINASKLDIRIPVDETEAELKNLADAINSLLDRINQSYQSQIRFVSDASHELRTPISVIEGYANLLDRWGKNDEKILDESISAIRDEASNMKGLVEQLLFLARGDNNSMSLQPQRFDIGQLADEVLRETRLIDGGHDFDSDFESAAVYADKGLIKQALRILMDNAIKYTNAGGKISLSVSINGDEALIIVQDEGIGIPPNAVAQIFDRFYRTDQSRARSTGGSGLGLSIAKWITERHGGHMEVLSRQGIGTRVTISIPALPDALSETLSETLSENLSEVMN